MVFGKQMELLKEACTQCSSEDAEKIIDGLREYAWDSKTTALLEKIRRFAVSYDFDKALEILEQRRTI